MVAAQASHAPRKDGFGALGDLLAPHWLLVIAVRRGGQGGGSFHSFSVADLQIMDPSGLQGGWIRPSKFRLTVGETLPRINQLEFEGSWVVAQSRRICSASALLSAAGIPI
jgi:hypothetical protein